MIGPLVLAFARQRLTSPMRLVLAASAFGIGVFTVLFTGSLEALGKSELGLFGLVFAAGLIGQEVSSGVLTLVFARPIRRAEYVLGRWLGACALGSAFVLLEVLAATGAALLRHGHPSPLSIAIKLLEGVLAVSGSSAVLLMFSSLVGGLGDLGLMLLTSVLGSALSGVAGRFQLGWLARASEEIQRFISASIDLAPMVAQGAPPWFAIASYVSTLAICLVVAIWAVNRKQLSYAAG